MGSAKYHQIIWSCAATGSDRQLGVCKLPSIISLYFQQVYLRRAEIQGDCVDFVVALEEKSEDEVELKKNPSIKQFWDVCLE